MIIYIDKPPEGDWQDWYIIYNDRIERVWAGHSWNPEWIFQEIIKVTTRLGIDVKLNDITFKVTELPYED